MKLKNKYYSDAVSVEELKKGCHNFNAVFTMVVVFVVPVIAKLLQFYQLQSLL